MTDSKENQHEDANEECLTKWETQCMEKWQFYANIKAEKISEMIKMDAGKGSVFAEVLKLQSIIKCGDEYTRASTAKDVMLCSDPEREIAVERAFRRGYHQGVFNGTRARDACDGNDQLVRDYVECIAVWRNRSTVTPECPPSWSRESLQK